MKRFLLPLFEKEKIYEAEKGICKVDTERKSEPQALHDSVYFASILSFKIKGAGVFKGFLFFPYLVCGIAVGFIFKFFYTRGFVLDTVLQWCGFELDNLPYWLKDTNINNISLAATSVWRYMGQNMVLFIGAIMSVDSSLYEAAAIDGASGWQKFRYVIFPSIKTIIVLNIIDHGIAECF